MDIFEADLLSKDIAEMLKDAKGIAAYALAKDLRMLTTELTEFNKYKADLFEKYGKKEGNTITIKPENLEAFANDMAKFEGETIYVPLRKLKEEELIESGLNGEQIFKIMKQLVE